MGGHHSTNGGVIQGASVAVFEHQDALSRRDVCLASVVMDLGSAEVTSVHRLVEVSATGRAVGDSGDGDVTVIFVMVALTSTRRDVVASDVCGTRTKRCHWYRCLLQCACYGYMWRTHLNNCSAHCCVVFSVASRSACRSLLLRDRGQECLFG